MNHIFTKLLMCSTEHRKRSRGCQNSFYGYPQPPSPLQTCTTTQEVNYSMAHLCSFLLDCIEMNIKVNLWEENEAYDTKAFELNFHKTWNVQSSDLIGGKPFWNKIDNAVVPSIVSASTHLPTHKQRFRREQMRWLDEYGEIRGGKAVSVWSKGIKRQKREEGPDHGNEDSYKQMRLLEIHVQAGAQLAPILCFGVLCCVATDDTPANWRHGSHAVMTWPWTFNQNGAACRVGWFADDRPLCVFVSRVFRFPVSVGRVGNSCVSRRQRSTNRRGPCFRESGGLLSRTLR